MNITDIESKINERIKNSTDTVFMLSDFRDFSEKRQLVRALSKLVKKGIILRVGRGIYVKAKKSLISYKLVPVLTLQEIGKIVAKKLNIEVIPSKYEEFYNRGLTTQVPTGLVIAILGRINRKIGFNGNYIKYETVRNQEQYYKFR